MNEQKLEDRSIMFDRMKKKGNFIDLFIPLNQQDVKTDKLINLLKEKIGLEVKETSTNSGLLMVCPKCNKQNKLFYSFDGKMFMCMDYKGCGLKCWSLAQLRNKNKKNGNK